MTLINLRLTSFGKDPAFINIFKGRVVGYISKPHDFDATAEMFYQYIMNYEYTEEIKSFVFEAFWHVLEIINENVYRRGTIHDIKSICTASNSFNYYKILNDNDKTNSWFHLLLDLFSMCKHLDHMISQKYENFEKLSGFLTEFKNMINNFFKNNDRIREYYYTKGCEFIVQQLNGWKDVHEIRKFLEQSDLICIHNETYACKLAEITNEINAFFGHVRNETAQKMMNTRISSKLEEIRSTNDLLELQKILDDFILKFENLLSQYWTRCKELVDGADTKTLSRWIQYVTDDNLKQYIKNIAFDKFLLENRSRGINDLETLLHTG
jgi:hypothetical protein